MGAYETRVEGADRWSQHVDRLVAHAGVSSTSLEKLTTAKHHFVSETFLCILHLEIVAVLCIWIFFTWKLIWINCRIVYWIIKEKLIWMRVALRWGRSLEYPSWRFSTHALTKGGGLSLQKRLCSFSSLLAIATCRFCAALYSAISFLLACVCVCVYIVRETLEAKKKKKSGRSQSSENALSRHCCSCFSSLLCVYARGFPPPPTSFSFPFCFFLINQRTELGTRPFRPSECVSVSECTAKVLTKEEKKGATTLVNLCLVKHRFFQRVHFVCFYYYYL